ncbi:MAG: CPBP family intramembrane metalloprotease [Chloroflexi bacterium]|nr:CPBP family intramembrane metalloprotease [Chloroflexota bacterium]
MKTWTKRQYLTYILLFALLLVDFSRSLFVLIFDLLDPSVVQIYTSQLSILDRYLFVFQWLGSFPVIIFILRLNRDRLQEMNMDRFYVCLLVIAGLIPLYKSPNIFPFNFFAVITVIALIYAVYFLFSNKVKFGVIDFNALRMILLITGVFAGITVCIAGFGEAIKINLPHSGQLLDIFLFQQIPGLIYEEAMYRGMLYIFLMDVGVSKSKAFYIQAFWFWIKHMHFSLPFFFWIMLPILSLTYGYIAMRSKSLTPSTLAHLLYSTLVLFVYS